MGIKESFSKQITKINMKTSSFLEENKIRTYINTLETEIKELYLKAGMEAFSMWKEGSADNENIVSMLKQIDEKQKQIAEQEELIQQIEEKNKQVLGESGTVAATASGTAAASADAAPQAQETVCPNCGAKYAAGVNFCRVCGTKLH